MTASEHAAELVALLDAHRYQEYLARYREVASRIPGREADLYLADVAYALMALRRYEEALDIATKFHRSGERTPKFARDLGRGLPEVGACQWMLCRKTEAVATWLDLCDGTRSGKYRYAKDPAGGVYAGLLSWFGATSAGDGDAELQARVYLEDRLERISKLNAGDIWPVPVARFVLGAGNVAAMIGAVLRDPAFLGGGDIDPSETIGRRNLSVAYLAAGASERHHGHESAAIEYFAKASALENPISEPAWYLARYEWERATQHE